MTIKVMDNGVVRDATGEEIAEIEARQAAIVVPAVPQQVTMRQARLALLKSGQLATINSAIAGMAGPTGDQARIEWEFSSEVKRNQALVVAMSAVLSMTSEQTDAMFVTAATL